MWLLAKWAQTTRLEPPPLPQFPPLKDREGRHHSANEAKADILAEHFFPLPVAADLADLEGFQYPPELPMSQDVSAIEVVHILKNIPPDETPGPDGIPNRFLRECRDVLAGPLPALFQECLWISYHPLPFRHSRTVVLRKPQKAAYDVPKAYRPIALLNTLGNILEKIVARRVLALAEEHILLPTTQVGARPGRSRGTALEMLTEQIQTVWASDPSLVASMLSLDISGAFDNVFHDRLIHNIRSARLPKWVAEYTRTFLTNRTTSLALGTYEDGVRQPRQESHRPQRYRRSCSSFSHPPCSHNSIAAQPQQSASSMTPTSSHPASPRRQIVGRWRGQMRSAWPGHGLTAPHSPRRSTSSCTSLANPKSSSCRPRSRYPSSGPVQSR